VAIIGTAKGGTTDVFYQLTKLIPELSHSFNERRSEGGNTKELAFLANAHFFSNSSHTWQLSSDYVRQYLRKLHHPCADRATEFLDCANQAENHFITMDATPSYLEKPWTPLNLHTLSPDTKIIAILRDPLERAMSYYNHQKSRSWKEGDYSHMNKTLDDYAEEFLSLVEDSSTPMRKPTHFILI
jgi:hypothetical protein